MNKAKLAEVIKAFADSNNIIKQASRFGVQHNFGKVDAEELAQCILAEIQIAIRSGNKVAFPELGSFRVVEKQARLARNPKTGEKVKVPAQKVVKFRSSSQLKEFVNK